MHDIIDGILKFRREAFPQRSALYAQLAHALAPAHAVHRVLHSRLAPELVTQQEPGEMFVIRNADNIAPSCLRYADSAKVVNEARDHRSARDKVELMVRGNVMAQAPQQHS